MCIIAAKPAGITMPQRDIIRTMWENNSDGAGFMYAQGGKVQIEKGFMTLKALESALDKLEKSLDTTATAIVLHFRIRTHGGTVAECTHPFPITDNIAALQKLRTRTDLGVAHNGIIHSVSPRKGISDTMEYIASQLAPLKRALPKFYQNRDAMLLVENAIDSKMAFLTKTGALHTIGDFTEDNGILYSNTSYKPFTCRFSTWSCYAGSVDDYFDGDYGQLSGSGPLSCQEMMWLDEDAGDYLDIDGEMWTGPDFLLDSDGKVWEYDYSLDTAIPVPDSRAFNAAGLPLQYKPELACTVYLDPDWAEYD